MKKFNFILIIVIVVILLIFFISRQSLQPSLYPNTISIASWNLKNIGKSKLNEPDRINIIVEIIKQYDIMAIQEVKDVSLELPNKLLEMINADGSNYQVVASDRVGRNVLEQYLFIYNDTIIDHIVGTTGYGIEPNDEFSREPFYAMFKSGNFDFYLMNIHTDPDDVAIEIPALKESFMHLQNTTLNEDDIILLGDFNAKSPATSVDSYFTMDVFNEIDEIVFAINDETNTRGGKAYDNIIFNGNYTSEYSGTSGVLIFWEDFGLDEDQGFRISDHKPVWAEFNISNSDDD